VRALDVLRRTAGLATLLLLAAPALAEEAGEAAEHGEHAAQTLFGLPVQVYWTVNLVVFLGILAYAAGPALVRFLEDKQQQLAHQLAEAARQRTEAEQMESRLAAQIAELRHEVDELAVRVVREGEREQGEILAAAKAECARIEASARAEIAHGLHQARQQLTAHAARLAAGLAEQRLVSGLTREDRKRLFSDNLTRLERKAEA
jgi:F-type H+-transporting ATPase subunit b